MGSLQLLCGLLCDDTIWADVPTRLANAARARSVAFGGFASIGAMAAHVLATAPPRFALAGHSMGGRVAQVLPTLSAMVQRASPESFAAQTQALLRRPDARAVLPTITVPTLLLSGTNDAWSSLVQHADMQRHIPHSRLVEIAGAGHMAPIERPDAVARALKAWLKTLGKDVNV